MKKFHMLAVSVAAFALGVVITATAAAQGVSFKGKQLKWVVNQAAGGMGDLIIRELGPFIEKHLPGRPKLIFINKGGGRFKLGAVYLFRDVKPDGYTAGHVSVIYADWSLGAKMPIPLEKFRYTGARACNQLVIVRRKAGLKSVDDVVKSKKTVVVGHHTLYSVVPVALRVWLDMIKPPRKHVPGYRGGMAAFKAMHSDELDMGIFNSDLYQQRKVQLKKDGIIEAIAQLGIIKGGEMTKEPGIELPTLVDTVKKYAPQYVGTPTYKAWIKVMGSMALCQVYALPPGTPDNMVAVWKKAVADAYADPGYTAIRAKRNMGPAIFIPGEATDKLVKGYAKQRVSPDFKKFWAKYGPKKAS